jgi:hypothetical protein
MKRKSSKFLFIVVLEVFCLSMFCVKDLLFIYDKNDGFGFLKNGNTLVYSYTEENHYLSKYERNMLYDNLNIDIYNMSGIIFDSKATVSISRGFINNKVIGEIMFNGSYISDEGFIKFLNDINIKVNDISKNYYTTNDSYFQISVYISEREGKKFTISISEKLFMSYNIKDNIGSGEKLSFDSYFYQLSEIKRKSVMEKTISLINTGIIKVLLVNGLLFVIYLIYKYFKILIQKKNNKLY